MKYLQLLLVIILGSSITAQDYFLKDKGPFNSNIPSPEEFLGYPIGFQHTRHDRIVDYLKELGRVSEKAEFYEYGKTYEGRSLVLLAISSEENIRNLENIRNKHIKLVNPTENVRATAEDPVIINLGYNVHGNEPSSSEAALLTAYILVASQHADIINYRKEAVVFVDPTINPDGRDRHTYWANSFKGKVLVDDPLDIEHNEGWPRGRTNHYWFDLNRDWWLAIHPESRGKLNWYHQWYPNVVTDFHEMGSNSSYFFEPMKTNGSKNPIMPKENYIDLNDKFAVYYSDALDQIGSLYFTKEVFDGTYPGYGSSYPDLQGGLGILFEQASSRGHVQKTNTGEITFPFTIRNQLTSSMATVKAAVENKLYLFDYQKEFFKSAISNAKSSKVKAYIVGDNFDVNRTNAFLDKLLIHKVEFYPLEKETEIAGTLYKPGHAFVVPTEQAQYRIVQSVFETYSEFQDSVFYDASSWSIANFYNMNYNALDYIPGKGEQFISINKASNYQVDKASYAYLIPWDDYNAPALLHYLQEEELVIMASAKEFSSKTTSGNIDIPYGTMMIPVSKQKLDADQLHQLIQRGLNKFMMKGYATNTGYSISGVDLGSRYLQVMEAPKVISLVGDGVSSYEAGEVWHLMDQRIGMAYTKAMVTSFKRINLDNYNTLILVSGSYAQLDSSDIQKIKSWVSKGNTLIATRSAVSWAIRKKLVNEKLVTAKDEKAKKDDKEDEKKKVERLPFIQAQEIEGKKSVGGTIFEVDLDLTHPIAYGYKDSKIPVYRNSTVWLAPSKNPYSNVAMYTDDPHIDGFITDENLEKYLKKSASIVVSRVGGGRAILFAENPNFRGSWYGTNKLFLNAIFFGKGINVPSVRE